MNVTSFIPGKPTPRQITAGAESIAAAQFARCGFDVSVQTGPDKPWHDLVVTRGRSLLKVSVRGSDDGSWPLTDGFVMNTSDRKRMRNNRREAINFWLAHHGPRTVCCLVQFHRVPVSELPRIYLATPAEVALKMRETAERLEDSTLYETYEWKAAEEEISAIETLPESWRFSEQRIEELVSHGELLGRGAAVLTGAENWPRTHDVQGDLFPLGISA